MTKNNQGDQKKGDGKTSDKPGAKSPEKANRKNLHSVEVLAKESNLPSWELAGLMQATGWAAGKQVGENEFRKALKQFRNRRQGGGRL